MITLLIFNFYMYNWAWYLLHKKNQISVKMWCTEKIIIFVWLLCIRTMILSSVIEKKHNTCHLPNSLIEEIDSYAPIVKSIIYEATRGSFKGNTWQDLANFVDKFGPRFSGTQTLEDAIDYVLNKSTSLGLDNVHGESAIIPRWVRYKIL